MGCQRLVYVPGDVVMVAGLQQLIDVLLRALGHGVDPPAPKRRRAPMGLADGVRVQRGDGPGRPPVHEMERVLVPAWHRGEQPGQLAWSAVSLLQHPGRRQA